MKIFTTYKYDKDIIKKFIEEPAERKERLLIYYKGNIDNEIYNILSSYINDSDLWNLLSQGGKDLLLGITDWESYRRPSNIQLNGNSI